MTDKDWLSTASFTADVPRGNSYAAACDAADSYATNTSSLTAEQKLFVFFGISGIAAYAIYTIYRGSQRGPPQLLWTASSSSLPSSLSCTFAINNNCRAPVLTLVNFSEQIKWRLELALRPLIDADELELRVAPVVFFHERIQITPSNVDAVVRQEVIAAFEQLGRVPCLVYRSAIAVNKETLDPFLTASDAVRSSQGRLLLERHCIGYTVDGGRVEILCHDTHGTVGAISGFLPKKLTDLSLDNVDDALRRHFCVTGSTFSVKTGEELGIIGDRYTTSEDSISTECIFGTQYSDAFSVLWLSPVPLFAMFGAALRYSCAEFDGWRRLADPSGGAEVSFSWVKKKISRLWRGKGEFDVEKTILAGQVRDVFAVEIDLPHSTKHVDSSLCDVLEAALAGSWEGSEYNKDPIDIGSLCAGGAVVVRCRLHPNLTVFQALREAWRLAALVACMRYDVQRFRLVVAVQRTKSTSMFSSVAPNADELLWPCMPLYPLSKDDAELSFPRFFSLAQYFCNRKDGSRIEAAEAFRRILAGETQQLEYVIGEYFVDEFMKCMNDCA